MKLSTLLLSSAALVVAGSAYAADLPAKKGAPAAKPATGCPAFGAGFFQIPGGDTCIQFSGHFKYSGTYTSDSTDAVTSNYSQSARFRLMTDVRSNTDIGTLRGFSRLNAATSGVAIDRAFVQFAGLTAGRNGSLADIAGTNADTYGSNLGGGTGSGLRYDLPVGAATVSFALENAADNNTYGTAPNTTSPVADRPDALIGFATNAGPANIKLVVASHDAQASNATGGSTQGYAVVGRVGAALGGGFGAAVFGGTSEAASKYTTAGNLRDFNGTDKSKGTNVGGEITFATGAGTFAVAADQSKETLADKTTKVTNVGISYVYNAAKGLAIEPEYVNTQTDNGTATTNSNLFVLRIQRDF
ncbi:MAG: porin [Alphaproteobacteria bacterium]